MRILQSSVFRALCAIVFGYLLVIYRNQMLHWTTIAFGALFFLSGLVSVIAYYAEKRRAANMAERLSAMSEMRGKEMETPSEDSIRHSLMPGFPIVGIGSMVLGVILAIMPTTFMTCLQPCRSAYWDGHSSCMESSNASMPSRFTTAASNTRRFRQPSRQPQKLK